MSERDMLLRRRLLAILSDLDSSLELLFINVNCTAEDREPGVTFVEVFRERFQLAEVVLALHALQSEGAVVTRSGPYPESAGLAGVWFLLTDAGQLEARAICSIYSRAELYEPEASGVIREVP